MMEIPAKVRKLVDAVSRAPTSPATIASVAKRLHMSTKEVQNTAKDVLIDTLISRTTHPDGKDIIKKVGVYENLYGAVIRQAHIVYELDAMVNIKRSELYDGMTYQEFLDLVKTKAPYEVSNQIKLNIESTEDDPVHMGTYEYFDTDVEVWLGEKGLAILKEEKGYGTHNTD